MAPTGETARLGHLPALDGLRGIAVLLVLAAHIRSPFVGESAGAVGVTVFFTLSGFLISTLLLQELEATGRISFRRFYERRARRLLPALVTVVLVTVGVTAVTGIPFVTWPEVVGALFYCTNVLRIFLPIQEDGMLHHTWSLVIEEQFYLVWPLVTLALWRRRRLLLTLTLVGAVLVFLQRIMLTGNAGHERLLFSVDTRGDAILIGCALALALRGARFAAPGRLGTYGGPGLVVIAMFSLSPVYAPTFLLGLSLVAVGAAAVITAVVAGTAPRWLAWGPLCSVGKVSYGLYLWHHVVMIFCLDALHLGGSWIAMALVMVPVSALLTWLSWTYVEQPFLRRREPAAQARRSTSTA